MSLHDSLTASTRLLLFAPVTHACLWKLLCTTFFFLKIDLNILFLLFQTFLLCTYIILYILFMMTSVVADASRGNRDRVQPQTSHTSQPQKQIQVGVSSWPVHPSTQAGQSEKAYRTFPTHGYWVSQQYDVQRPKIYLSLFIEVALVIFVQRDLSLRFCFSPPG